MHFHAALIVRFVKPVIDEKDNSVIVGYSIAIGVNTEDFCSCAKLVYDTALGAYSHDFENLVLEEATITFIQKSDWEKSILKSIKNIDKTGVYYVSGMAFFREG